MPGRPIFDHKLRLRQPSNSGAITQSSAAGLHQPYLAGGRLYPETFSVGTSTEDKTVGAGEDGSVTSIGPFFTGGGSKTWDIIGCFARWSSSPGVAPRFKFVIYNLDTETLFPTSLVYESASLHTVSNTAHTWFEDSISVTTTASWLGIGWLKEDVGLDEVITFRAWGFTIAVDNHQGYAPYGHARSGDTLTPRTTLYSIGAVSSTAAPAPGTFAISPATGVGNAQNGTGVFLRLA